jgi:hypothetical protein
VPETSAVPFGTRLVHEIWWMVFRWPKEERIDGRAALRKHYAGRKGSQRG